MDSIQDLINASNRTGMIEFSIDERNADYVVSRMPVSAGILNPYGVVQAGAMIWLADVTASVLAMQGQPVEDNGMGFPLAIDLHSTLLGNQRDGIVRAEARFVRRGRKIIVIRTRITGNNDKLLAEVTTTHTRAS